MKRFTALFAVPAAFSALVLPFAAQAQTKTAPLAAVAPAASNEPILCVVKGETIASPKDAAGKTTFHNKTYYFCCPGCISAFNKGSDAQKAKYAKTTDLRVRQIVLQKQLDAVKTELKQVEKTEKAAPAAVKHDAAPMHDHAASAAASTKNTGFSCPVTGEAIASVSEAGGKSDFNGKTYYFCCSGCKSKFDAAPAKYAAAADKRAAGGNGSAPGGDGVK